MLFGPLALVTLLAVAPAATDCTASEAAWQWGFKESFRAYLSGSIAQGEWTTSGDVEYETPAFFTDTARGEVSLLSLSGELAAEGGMRFTGHAGILDTTIDDIRLRFDGAGGLTVVADIVGTTQDFEPVDATDVTFLTGDLEAALWRVEGDQLVIADVPLTLTASGAEAFGTYPQGEAFDPMTVRVSTTQECAQQALDARAPSGLVAVGLWVAAGLGALLVAVAAIAALRRRRRRAIDDRHAHESGA